MANDRFDVSVKSTEVPLDAFADAVESGEVIRFRDLRL